MPRRPQPITRTITHEPNGSCSATITGGVILIDPQDLDLVCGLTWYVNAGGDAFRTERDPRDPQLRDGVYLRRLLMERVLGREMGRKDRVVVRNHNKLDLRRANLALAADLRRDRRTT